MRLSVVTLFFFLASWYSAYAADGSIFLVPASGTYNVGDTFDIGVYARTDGVPVTAGEAELSFNPNTVDILAVSTAGSAFELWSTEPTFSREDGTVRFAGWATRPFTRDNALLMTMTVRVTTAGVQRIQTKTGALLAYDGKGSNIIATLGSGAYTAVVRQATSDESQGLVLGVSQQGEDVPPPPPRITELPHDVPDSDPIVFRGTAIPDARVALSITNATGEEFRYTAEADSTGDFVVAGDALPASTYLVRAEAQLNGLVSKASVDQEFTVYATGIQPLLTAAIGFAQLPSTATTLVLLFGFLCGYGVYLLWFRHSFA
jgi:hypothetical protein